MIIFVLKATNHSTFGQLRNETLPFDGTLPIKQEKLWRPICYCDDVINDATITASLPPSAEVESGKATARRSFDFILLLITLAWFAWLAWLRSHEYRRRALLIPH